MKKDYMKNEEQILKVLAFLFAFAGLAVLTCFIIRLSKTYSISPELAIAMDKTGQVGDFVGGIVGTLWSFSGMLLFYLSLMAQRKDLRDQEDRWNQQRVEDNYYRLIDSYMKIDYLLDNVSKNLHIQHFTIGIRNGINPNSSLIDNKKIISSSFYDPNIDNTNIRLAKSLLFIVNFLYSSESDTSRLTKHLTWIVSLEEKELLFYYLIAHTYELEPIFNKYMRSDLVPYSINEVRLMAHQIDPSLATPLDFNEIK